MALTETTRLKLPKQDQGDPAWHTNQNAGMDKADDRLLSTGSGSPVGVEEGFYVGHLYYDTSTSPPTVWICTAVGTPGTWVVLSQLIHGGQIKTALELDNNIPLQAKDTGAVLKNLAKLNGSDKVELGNTGLNLDVLGALIRLIADSGSDIQLTASGAGNIILTAAAAAQLLVNFGSGNKRILHEDDDPPLFSTYALVEIGPNFPSSGGTHTVAHGLGAAPRLWSAYAVAVNNNNGWVAGDEIAVAAAPPEAGRRGLPWADATSFGWLVHGTGSPRTQLIQQKVSPFGEINIAGSADWKLRFKGFK